MATCVTLTDLTDWSLVKIFSQNREIFVKRMAEKLLFTNLQKSLLCSDDCPFIKAFFGNRTWSILIVSCAILGDLVRWSSKTNSVKTVKFRLQKAEIQNVHCITVLSRYTAYSTLIVTCVIFKYLTDWSLVEFQLKPRNFSQGDCKKAPLQKSSKSLFIFLWFPVYQSFLWE